MFYLGIDIGKNTHVASHMDEKLNVIFKAPSFSNTSEGAATLLQRITPYRSELEIRMEATGHYWLSLYSFLVENNFVVHVINPIQTDGQRKGTKIRKQKTDIIDSVLTVLAAVLNLQPMQAQMLLSRIQANMSKRGSPYLHKALFRAAFVASHSDPVFKAYYQKKRMEGKHHNVAVGAVARKLCYTIYAVLKNNVSNEIQAPKE